MHPYLKRPWQKKKTFQTFQAQSLRISENYRNNHRHCRLKFNPSSSCVCTRRVYRLAFRWEIDRSFCVYNIGWRVGTWLVLWPWTGYSNQDACAAGFDHLTSRDPCIASSLSLPLPLPLPSSVSLSLFLSPSPRVSPLLPWKVAFHFHIPFFPFKCYTRSALSYDSSSGRPLVRARARAYALERIACSAFTIRARVKADRKEWNLILSPSALTFTTRKRGTGIFDFYSFSLTIADRERFRITYPSFSNESTIFDHWISKRSRGWVYPETRFVLLSIYFYAFEPNGIFTYSGSLSHQTEDLRLTRTVIERFFFPSNEACNLRQYDIGPARFSHGQ